ncbi:Wzz/FepE/Etk N-terminal domain-containing protein [Photobacterium kagoshimensis]|uniref:Wzz/FepE/Etk N-terminal domain-containing protein n=1 Tax=Photobacterium kagoshimensis TaxID=2910242 RepID=UPI003D0F0204
MSDFIIEVRFMGVDVVVSDKSDNSRDSFYSEVFSFYRVLKDGWKSLVLSTLICLAVFTSYAFCATEWWTARAKIVEPQIKDMEAFYLQAVKFKSVFDGNADEIKESEGYKPYQNLINRKNIISRFVEQFNSQDNKISFLIDNKDKLEKEDKLKSDFYIRYLNKIKAERIPDKDIYELSFQSTSKGSSYTLLNQYVNFVNEKVYVQLFEELKVIVSTELLRIGIEKQITEERIFSELEKIRIKTKYALEIAVAASIDKPVELGIGENTFSFNLGVDALKAKLKILNEVKDPAVFSDKLDSINEKVKLFQLNGAIISSEIQTFHFVEKVAMPHSKDKPEKALIVILGLLIGLSIGVSVVFLKEAYSKCSKSRMTV